MPDLLPGARVKIRTANPDMFYEDEDAEGILAWLFALKRVKRRDGVWWAEFFGGTEIELRVVVRNHINQLVDA